MNLGYDNEANVNISIKICDKIYSFENKKFILIGRADICDIIISSQYCSVSRVGAIVIPLKDIIIFLDSGSLFGIKTTYSDSVEKQHSLPGKRQPITIKQNQFTVLTLGSEGADNGVVDVAFNPKLCAICMENGREILSDCGHYSMCKECHKKVNGICPLCREDVGNGMECDAFITKMI